MSRKNKPDKTYGLQADERQEMKARLGAILEVHKQRKDERAAEESESGAIEATAKAITLPPPPAKFDEQEEVPSSEVHRASREHALSSTEEVKKWTGSDDYEPQDDERAVQTPNGVVFVKNPQEQPNLYIAVRTPELQDYESAGVIYEVRTNRYLITWRLRTEADGDAEYVYGEPHYKHKVDPTPPPVDAEAKAQADRVEWLRQFTSGRRNEVLWAPTKGIFPDTSGVSSSSFGGASRRPGD